MSVRVGVAVARPPSPGSPAAPSTSQRSSGANGTNHAGGTDQVLVWIWIRNEVAWPGRPAKLLMAASTASAVKAADHSCGTAVLSRDRPSHERSRVCHGQI